MEGLSIAAAVKNFEGYIIQSKHCTVILSDSKPCVDAYNKLLRGQFSSNARLSTFLSTVIRHHVEIEHLAGNLNLTADFASRNPAVCDDPDRCCVCNFVKELEASVVQSTSVSDIISGSSPLPFTNRKTWIQVQSEYPGEILHGFIMALHLRLSHPSVNEMSKVFKRYFWAINMDKALTDCVASCHQCASLKKAPHALIPQASSDPPHRSCLPICCRCSEKKRSTDPHHS